MPVWLVWGLVVGIGACVGSFLNVCIHRLPRRQSLVAPRSQCPGCRRPIPWYENVPVLSYIFLGGRCSGCRAPISTRYPLVETGTALLFGLLFASLGPTPLFVVQSLFGAALIALILIDAEHQILPDAITLPGIVMGLFTSPFRDSGWEMPGGVSLDAALDATVGAALGYAMPWGINALYRVWQGARGVPKEAREDGIGHGDFKLLAMIGAVLGVELLFFSLFLGAVSGAIVGLFMIAFRGYGLRSRLPYGVFLGSAALLALFVGERWVAWYLEIAGVGP